jgi:hypothetical protein
MPPHLAPGPGSAPRTFPAPGAHGSDAPADPPRRRRARTILIGVLIVILLGGGGAYGALRWSRAYKVHTATVTTPTPAPLPSGDPITSRQTDPKPLTTTEAFGNATVPSRAGAGYTVVTSEVIDCASVATGKIATLLASLGCTQAVRATLLSADHAYVITTGIVNLPDASAADAARTALEPLVATGTSRFVYLDAAGKPSVSAVTTHLGWDSRGHFLSYAVIALANGKPISATDSRTAVIINDLVEQYLDVTVIGARETASG